MKRLVLSGARACFLFWCVERYANKPLAPAGQAGCGGVGPYPLSCPLLVLKYVALCTIFHREKGYFNIFHQHATSFIIVYETNNIVQ